MDKNKDIPLERILTFSKKERLRIKYIIAKHHFMEEQRKGIANSRLIRNTFYGIIGAAIAFFLFTISFLLFSTPPQNNAASPVALVSSANYPGNVNQLSSQEYAALQALTKLAYTADNLAVAKHQQAITIQDLLSVTNAAGDFLTPPGVGASNALEISYLLNPQSGGVALATIADSVGGLGLYVYLPSLSSHAALYRLKDVYTAHATFLNQPPPSSK